MLTLPISKFVFLFVMLLLFSGKLYLFQSVFTRSRVANLMVIGFENPVTASLINLIVFKSFIPLTALKKLLYFVP